MPPVDPTAQISASPSNQPPPHTKKNPKNKNSAGPFYQMTGSGLTRKRDSVSFWHLPSPGFSVWLMTDLEVSLSTKRL